jgi:hypothetical protein
VTVEARLALRSLEADRFGTRVQELALTSSNLQRERDELLTAIHQADRRPVMEPILAGLCDQIRHVIAIEESPPKKTLIRALVQDIEVRSRKEIYPSVATSGEASALS